MYMTTRPFKQVKYGRHCWSTHWPVAVEVMQATFDRNNGLVLGNGVFVEEGCPLEGDNLLVLT
jgi:hypothetical protein